MRAIPFSRAMLLLGLLGALLLVSCGDPRDMTIPTDPGRWGSSLEPSLSRLPDDDRRLVVSYLARIKAEAALSGQPIAAGLTVRQAIQDEREYQRRQTDARLQTRQQQDREQQRLREFDQQVAQVVSVKLIRKDVAPTDLSGGNRSDRATVQFELQNLGTQEITELNGTIELLDGFMRERLKTVDFRLDETLAPGDNVRWETTLTLDLFLISDLRLKNTDSWQIGVAFHARLVQFADGRRMEPPTT